MLNVIVIGCSLLLLGVVVLVILDVTQVRKLKASNKELERQLRTANLKRDSHRCTQVIKIPKTLFFHSKKDVKKAIKVIEANGGLDRDDYAQLEEEKYWPNYKVTALGLSKHGSFYGAKFKIEINDDTYNNLSSKAANKSLMSFLLDEVRKEHKK